MKTINLARSLSLLLLLPLAGCGFFIKGDAAPQPTPLTSFRPMIAAHVLWTAQVGATPSFVLTPAVDGDAVYAASESGSLSRIDAATGHIVWQVQAGAPLETGVGAGGGLVLVGTAKGKLLAYGTDGHRSWSHQLPSELVGAPVVSEDTVLARTLDGHIFALDAKDGTTRWSYAHTVPTLVLQSHGGLIAARGGVFAGFPGGALTALSLHDGVVGWETAVARPQGATEIERLVDIAGRPVLSQDQICAAAWQGKLGCYDARTGTPIWSRDTSIASALATDGHAVYSTDADGRIEADDFATGARLWRQMHLMWRQPTGPTVQGNSVVVGDDQGYVHFMAADDGLFQARLGIDGSAIRSAPVTDGDQLLVQTEKGTLALLATH